MLRNFGNQFSHSSVSWTAVGTQGLQRLRAHAPNATTNKAARITDAFRRRNRHIVAQVGTDTGQQPPNLIAEKAGDGRPDRPEGGTES